MAPSVRRFSGDEINCTKNSRGVNGIENAFMLKDTPVENFRPLKVIVIGAGFSGILCGIRIPQRLRNVDLTVYEKNEGVGGVRSTNLSLMVGNIVDMLDRHGSRTGILVAPVMSLVSPTLQIAFCTDTSSQRTLTNILSSPTLTGVRFMPQRRR